MVDPVKPMGREGMRRVQEGGVREAEGSRPKREVFVVIAHITIPETVKISHHNDGGTRAPREEGGDQARNAITSKRIRITRDFGFGEPKRCLSPKTVELRDVGIFPGPVGGNDEETMKRGKLEFTAVHQT